MVKGYLVGETGVVRPLYAGPVSLNIIYCWGVMGWLRTAAIGGITGDGAAEGPRQDWPGVVFDLIRPSEDWRNPR